MSYMNSFFKEEEGIETIEFIGLVAVAAALIAIIARIGGSMVKKADQGEQNIDKAINDAINTYTGGNGGNGGNP